MATNKSAQRMNALLTPRSFHFHAPNHWEVASGKTHVLEVLVWGEDLPPDAPVVVCVHGLTRNAHDFLWLASALAPTHKVYALSMAGRGGSARLTDVFQYNYGTYLSDCLAFITQHQLSNIHWIGTSMGGIIGMMVAAHAPQLVKSLLINDIGHIVPASALSRIYSYAGVPHIFDTRAACEDYLREVLAPWCIPSHAMDIFLSNSIWLLPNGQFSPSCDADILAAVKFTTEDFTKVEDVSLEQFWDTITCPVLLLHGLASDILPLPIAQAMCSKPHVTYQHYAGVGHAPALMDAEQIARVESWVKTGI